MKVRQREALRWWLAFGLASAVFLVWPGLDLLVAAWFQAEPGQFPADQHPLVQAIYVWAPRLGQAAFALALAALLLGRWLPRMLPHGWGRPLPRWLWRRLLAWVLVVVLGVGLVVHEALKNRVGRPRPVQVEQMGGSVPFVPVFTVSPYCQRNCSFVSGHAAIGFSLMAVGMWAAPVWRRRWWRSGLLAGLGIGLVRMAQGGHFLSDIVFAGLAIWGSSLLVQALWRRWLGWRLQRQAQRAAARALRRPMPW